MSESSKLVFETQTERFEVDVPDEVIAFIENRASENEETISEYVMGLMNKSLEEYRSKLS